MNLEELYELERLEREYAMASGTGEDELIFSEKEFALLDTMYAEPDVASVRIGNLQFQGTDLKALRDAFSGFDFSQGVKADASLVPAHFTEAQRKFVLGLLEKLEEVEEGWEFEDENRWEFDPAVSSVGLLYMMNDIEREQGGDERNDAIRLSDDAYRFLTAIYQQQPGPLDLSEVSFTDEQLQYVRQVLSQSGAPVNEEMLSLPQQQFIREQVLELCANLRTQDQTLDDARKYSLEELLIMDRDVRQQQEVDYEELLFSDDEYNLLEAVFRPNKTQGVEVAAELYTPDQLNYLHAVFSHEADWDPLHHDLGFSVEQEGLVLSVLDAYEGQFDISDEDYYLGEEDDEDESPWAGMDEEDEEEWEADIVTLFIMDEVEREEMAKDATYEGDLLFTDDQYALLQAVFDEDRDSSEGAVAGSTGIHFSGEQLGLLEAMFSFDEQAEEAYEGDPLSEEQAAFVAGIFQQVDEAGKEE